MNEDQQKPEQDQAAGWQYKTEDSTDSRPSETAGAAPQTPDSITWTASEFIAYEKNFGWYAIFILIAAVVVAVIYFVTHDVISAVALAVFFVLLVVASSRKPRTLQYRVDQSGITVGARLRPFDEFKSFVLVNEGPFWSIVFLPMKRFALPLSLYLAPEQEQAVVEVLSNYLPVEQTELGGIDRLMHRLHF